MPKNRISPRWRRCSPIARAPRSPLPARRPGLDGLRGGPPRRCRAVHGHEPSEPAGGRWTAGSGAPGPAPPRASGGPRHRGDDRGADGQGAPPAGPGPFAHRCPPAPRRRLRPRLLRPPRRLPRRGDDRCHDRSWAAVLGIRPCPHRVRCGMADGPRDHGRGGGDGGRSACACLPGPDGATPASGGRGGRGRVPPRSPGVLARARRRLPRRAADGSGARRLPTAPGPGGRGAHDRPAPPRPGTAGLRTGAAAAAARTSGHRRRSCSGPATAPPVPWSPSVPHRRRCTA